MSLLEKWSAKKLLEFTSLLLGKRNLSNKSAIVTKIRRPCYLKHYPVKVIQPDGSSFTIRYFEPRRIIKLPIDLSILSEEEKNQILENRKAKKKIVVEEDDLGDTFSSKEYLKKMKKIV